MGTNHALAYEVKYKTNVTKTKVQEENRTANTQEENLSEDESVRAGGPE